MRENQISISDIDAIETSIERASRDKLGDLLRFFQYIQETLLLAFDNADQSIPIPNIPNNPQLFTFVATTRAFSISKTAMNQTIRGYPFVGMALSRTLLEINQCNQYLVRNPSSIDGFLSGKIKLDQILKLAKTENTASEHDYFGRFWGLLSRYSHASPDLLAISLSTTEDKMTASLVIKDIDRIEEAAYSIMASLFAQYLIFRLVTIKDLPIAAELNQRDKVIFLPDNIRKYAKFESISDADLDWFYEQFKGSDESQAN